MKIHDFVAIGLGPFNLGLACLSEPLARTEGLDGVFLEAREGFDWHPGMLLDEATLQVPFLADLVTMADPTSRWSFLNYLKQHGHLYPFYIRENFYPLRREYDDYCRWAAESLGSIRFGQRVTRVEYDGSTYRVHSESGEIFGARRIVVGIGTAPHVPGCLREIAEPSGQTRPSTSNAVVTHSCDYLAQRTSLKNQKRITIIGSGQSAAEIYYDLLLAASDHDYELVWLTRSPRFFPMEYTKLTLEMTSPEYAAHHRGLPIETRERLAREQRHLSKGISGDLVDAIFDAHYQQRVAGGGPRTTLLTNTQVCGSRLAATEAELELQHTETGESFSLTTGGLVLATGYAPRDPTFLVDIEDRIRRDARERYDVAQDYSVDIAGGEIFVQNAEEHTHSLLAPDLGMGPYRNSVILAAMLGREPYPIEKRVAVQTFGVPDRFRFAAGHATVKDAR